MNLHRLLAQRAEACKPVRVGLIGGGKFGTMFLAQARSTPGLQVLGVADLQPDRARRFMRDAGWLDEQMDAPDFDAARSTGRTHLTDDGPALIAASGLDVVVEATGDPRVGTRHALAAIEQGRHLVMVNVEADVLVGPVLAARPAGGPGVQPRVRRSAGIDLRDGRLGAPAASPWCAQARARATCPISTSRRPRPCGSTSGSLPPRPRPRA